ncbi:MAG TPA: hypothetical protein VLJ59_00560 [Mycobacteriales bacterium]|nr:hypothetical protein [Mycobacteriales bacterium]
MPATTVIQTATRAALPVTAAAGVAASIMASGVHPAAADPHPVRLAPTAAITSARDLPEAPVANDYNWRAFASRYLGGDTVMARQCTAFVLWRIDHRLRLADNTTLIRLSNAYRMTGAKDLDNAAVRARYKVDRTGWRARRCALSIVCLAYACQET